MGDDMTEAFNKVIELVWHSLFFSFCDLAACGLLSRNLWMYIYIYNFFMNL